MFNKRIRELQVPHTINRKFPEIKEKNNNFKSSELKLFIFYWSLPLLMDLLSPPYWYMLCAYVFSVRTYYEPINNYQEIYEADKFFKAYFTLMDDYFGKYAYTYTLHAHLHLGQQVIKLGNLHANSQFVFEVKFYLNLFSYLPFI